MLNLFSRNIFGPNKTTQAQNYYISQKETLVNTCYKQ